MKNAVLSFHDALLAVHGGSPGLRDDGLLDSAMARPKQLHHYERSSTIFQLAAAYGFGLSKNHPFVDGNKRVALTATAVFLEINGWRLQAAEAEAVVAFTGLAAGELDEGRLASWLEQHSVPAKRKL